MKSYYNKKIICELLKLKDQKYKDFQSSLIPNIKKDYIIGVKTNDLKSIAKEIYDSDSTNVFINELPHKYFEENQLHAFLISKEKNFDICIKEVNKFLNYVDNWATCDQLNPNCFNKNITSLYKYIKTWIKSKKAYKVRFAIRMLMKYYLDDNFDKKYLDIVSNINFPYDNKKNHNISISYNCNKYYVEMMIAWYFATALSKQYESTLPYIKSKKLLTFTHNKTIQKAIESNRVSNKHKLELKKYKI